MNKVLAISFFILLFSSCSEGEANSMDETPLPLTKDVLRNNFIIPKVPVDIIFAGEHISFKDVDLKERLDNELVINNFWHSNTILMMKRSNRWLPLMREIFQSEDIPEDLIYIAVVESGLMNVTSPKGAKGFWQFMPATGKEYGLVINQQMDERYHVEKSTRAACQYLKNAYIKFDSWVLAAAAYNLGMNGIASNLKRQQVESYFDLSLNSETARYVFRILAVKLVFENAANYGFYLESESLYPSYLTKEVIIDSSIPNLYEWSKEHGISIKILRTLNPWIKGQEFKVKDGEVFSFKIPVDNEQLGLIKG